MQTLLTRMKDQVREFFLDEDGQSTVEYILMLMIVVAIALKFKGKITGFIESATGKIGDNINQAAEDK